MSFNNYSCVQTRTMRRDLIALPENSKVWIYQADKSIPEDTCEAIKEALYDFSMSWISHGVELDCYGHLFHSQFLVLVADSSNLPSGCSIDSSVHFIEGLGQRHKVNFFDRMTFTYMQDEVVYAVHTTDFKDKFDSGAINAETLVFDNLVNDKSTFINEWIKPLKDSWHMKFL